MNIFNFYFPFFIKKKIRSFESEFAIKPSNKINIFYWIHKPSLNQLQ